MKPLIAAGAALSLATLVLTPAHAQEFDRAGNRTYEVTITNATKGQVFSPPVLVTHTRDIALFEVGAPALPELAAVAEDGNGAPLVKLLNTLDAVGEAQTTPAPILPGGTAVYEISTNRRFSVFSIASMLVNTNDAFFALDSALLPFSRHKSLSLDVNAYDAGSEANNEDCGFVPGPACPPDSGNARDEAGAEGYVYVHNGVHGTADLSPAAYDWRNPVARITIKRIH